MLQSKWKLAVDAYEGGGGFSDGTYIDQYPRESDDKYTKRKEIAYYHNMFRQKVARYTGYLFRERPTRSSGSPLVKLIFDDADKRGNHIDIFMASFAAQAKIRGAMLLLVDMLREIPPPSQSRSPPVPSPTSSPSSPSASPGTRSTRSGGSNLSASETPSIRALPRRRRSR